MPKEADAPDPIRSLLRDMVLFEECVERTLQSRTNRNQWYRRTETVADALKNRLCDESVQSMLEPLLQHVTAISSDNDVAKEARTMLLKDATRFISLEMRLRDIVDLPRSNYWRAVAFSNHTIRDSARPFDTLVVPPSAKDYAEEVLALINDTLAQMHATVQLSRKHKKRSRLELSSFVWRRLIGGVIALANGWHFMEHGGNSYAVSVVCGAGLMGYNGPLTRTLAKSIRSAAAGTKKRVKNAAGDAQDLYRSRATRRS